MTKPRIGFIGLGLMGAAMVRCLQSKGYPLTVLGNRNRAPVDAAVAAGASEAADARALAQASDIVMLCMGTSDQVEGRMRGETGVIAGLKPGTVVVDFGTSLPASTRALAAEVAAAGGAYLDAPLGRTPAHAEVGQLNIMAAGDSDAFEKIRPVLQDQGENVFYLGASGTGHTVKLINNFFGMTTANAMAEAFATADAAGLDRQALYDVMSAGPLHSSMMDFVKGYAIDGTPDQLAFSIANASKDVGYYARMTDDLGRQSAIAAAVSGGLDMARDGGHGDEMVSQMVDFFAKNGTAK